MVSSPRSLFERSNLLGDSNFNSLELAKVLKVDDQESHTLTVKAKGPGEVNAAQIQCPAGVEVVNTDLKICTLSNDSTLDMEVSIAHGVGYRLADKNKTSDSSFIPIDSMFSPVV